MHDMDTPHRGDNDQEHTPMLHEIDGWLGYLADQLDANVALLAQVEDAFPAGRRLARQAGADELAVRRGEHAFLEGVDRLASLSVVLRRGTAAGLGVRFGPASGRIPGATAFTPDDVRPAHREAGVRRRRARVATVLRRLRS